MFTSFSTQPGDSSVTSLWHPRLTFWRPQNLSYTHLHTTTLIFPHAPLIQWWAPSFFFLQLWLHATLHRRYQGNWQWLEICSIIEPRTVWLTGLGPPLLETGPSYWAISDIQFVLKFPLRGPKGPDLINIFYGEPWDVTGSASSPVLIIVQAHYGWPSGDGDSETWQWLTNTNRQRSDWCSMGWRFLIFLQGLWVIVQLHWWLGHASLRLIRSDSCKRVTMLRWIEFVSSTVLSITYQGNEPLCK